MPPNKMLISKSLLRTEYMNRGVSSLLGRPPRVVMQVPFEQAKYLIPALYDSL